MEEEVFEAELAVANRDSSILNGLAGATVAVSLAFLMLAITYGDLAGTKFSGVDDSEDYGVRVPVWERGYLDYITDQDNGFVMEFGEYEVLETSNEWNSTHVFVEYELPLDEGGAAPNGKISLAYWRPNVPEGVTVPVIAEFGPYFQEPSVQTPTIEVPGSWLGEMIIDQLLPHGYAFAQISVTGTGRSNHCMDLMGNAEQLGNDAAVTWLGSQDWSNGNVAMIGKSYDGSTPWQAAMFGNEHLKTIVPISGLIGVKELMWKNGSSEARAPIMHNGVYGSYGVDGDEEDYQNLCPDYIIGPGTGVGAWAWGGEAAGEYWAERYFLDRVIENYGGSVYLIQGMHDWNVDPHMAVPTMNTLIDNGIEAKGLFGQWDHDYPDRAIQLDDRSDLGGRGGEAFPEMIRFDWMQDLLEWFDYYLRGIGDKPGLWVEIQSNQGSWRIEDRYPASDTTELVMALGSDLSRISGGQTVLPDASTGPVYESAPLEETLYIQGLPRLHVEVSTTTVGGQLYALLEDCDGTNCIHIGHAIMDLRYHQGGDELSPSWAPIVGTITAKMEFFALDAEIAAGHTIRVSLVSTGEDYLPASTSSIVTIQEGEGSTLQLDTFQPDDKRYWTPPVCTHTVCL
ncbi:MAG: CocE/NonD family hydrolase [Candidatus Poseidoniales archaeon]|nr:MAG: CocE/NonD family hydrolase [Candidatus Poseidoniales archaeon]